MKRIALGTIMLVLALGTTAYGSDWPTWRGPDRDAKAEDEKGLLDTWPKDGPKELWSVSNLGKGYSTVAVADGMLYTTGLDGKDGYVYSLTVDGQKKWRQKYGPEWNKSYPGARTTPTIDGDRLYVMSAMGRVVCMDRSNGNVKWSVDTMQTYGARQLKWGITESLFIDGDTLYCTPGGGKAQLVALDKNTGKEIWTNNSIGEASGYCSPRIIKHGGKAILVTMMAKSVVGLDPKSGKLLWSSKFPTAHDVHPNTPVYDDGLLYISGGYGSGGAAYKVGTSSLSQAWKETALDCHHGGFILIDGYVYGTGHKNAKLVCLELKSGAVKQQGGSVGKGSLFYADGHLYHYGKNGWFGLVKVKKGGYDLVSKFRITKGEGEHWAHPVVNDGKLYVRHGSALMCFDVKK